MINLFYLQAIMRRIVHTGAIAACGLLLSCGGGGGGSTGPANVVSTSQVGSVLYLTSLYNGHTSRIGLDSSRGGAIVEVSYDGTNYVNTTDLGRDIQPALYDGAAEYNQTAGLFGWDPVLAGDTYLHPSQVTYSTMVNNTINIRTIPMQWYPGILGSAAVPATDVVFEQTVSVVPGSPLAFQLQIKTTYTGSATRYTVPQEYPAVYLNSAYHNFLTYSGNSPWTNDGTLAGADTLSHSLSGTGPGPALASSERWGALVDNSNNGLLLYMPVQYPLQDSYFSAPATQGVANSATNYFRPFVVQGFQTGQTFAASAYLIPGPLAAARSQAYAIHTAVGPQLDILPPLGIIDLPDLSTPGTAVLRGWVIDDTSSPAQITLTVALDGVPISLAGSNFQKQMSRPDVATAYPGITDATNSGWNLTLSGAQYVPGLHTVTVTATDAAGNVGHFARMQ